MKYVPIHLKVPAMIIGIPVWVGRKLHAHYRLANKHKRNTAITAGVMSSVSGHGHALLKSISVCLTSRSELQWFRILPIQPNYLLSHIT